MALVACAALSAAPAHADKTLWLVRPLYPGQDALVEKTERALARLIAPEERARAIIGKAELVAALKDQRFDEVPCISGTKRCADPIDAFVAMLGFSRVMLVKGGQDEVGFKFEVASYEPRAGRSQPSEASNASLERALLGAVVKVYPASSTLEVRSSPPGAAVFIDDAKVGVSPLSTTLLPGEHSVRLQAKLHQPLEETVVIPFRGQVLFERTLERMAAQVVVTVQPPGSSIFIDGQLAGKDRVDRGILPGQHTLRLTAEGHKDFEQTISVKAEQEFVLDKVLEPLFANGAAGASGGPPDFIPNALPDAGTPVTAALVPAVPLPPGALAPAVPPPTPPAASEVERSFDERGYLLAGAAFVSLLGSPAAVVGRSLNGAAARPQHLQLGSGSLVGVEIDSGIMGRYFGVSVLGLAYLTNGDPWTFSVGWTPGSAPQPFTPASIGLMKLHLVHLRALQPQFRLCIWRFQLLLQAGVEGRTGLMVSSDPAVTAASSPLRDGFMPIDLLFAGRFGLRFRVLEGLFAYAAGTYWHRLLGEATEAGVASSSAMGLTTGVGYAF